MGLTYVDFVNHILGPAWAARERSPYLKVASRLEKERRLSLDERQARQWRDLRKLIEYAWDQSPWYRRRFSEAGFEPGDLKDWEDFPKLPVLTKEEIRENRESIRSRTWPGERLVRKTTSGSTGVSLEFYTDTESLQWKRGVEIFRDRWTGWRLGEYRANVWGNPPPMDRWRFRLRNRLLGRMFFLDTLRMNEAALKQFVLDIARYRPTLLFGHAHSLCLFALYWREHGLPDYRFRAVLSTAMVLHDHERAAIESAFGPNVFDRYGCEEVSLIASECEQHRGLHLNTDSLVVEVLDQGPDVVDGAGPVVVTDLTNRGMPFIRYLVGDMAERDGRSCPCGRSYPLLRRVAGRTADYLVAPNGDLISGISLTENFATRIPGVKQMQIIQEERTRLRLRTVKGPDFGEKSHAAIRRLLGERFGPEMTADLEFVDRIAPEPSGKYRFTICRLKPASGPGRPS